MAKLTSGKLKGLQKVSDQRGVIAAAAMDQRGSLRKAIAKERGLASEQVTPEMMGEFKAAVTRVLTPYASAILLDPEYGLAASRERSANAGLLLAYEKSGYDKTAPGRMPDLLPLTVKQLIDDGANAIKVLMYYTPLDPPGINQEKQAFVARIGAECAYWDVPFFLEFVGYDPEGDEKSPTYARKKPEIVTRSMAEFSKPEYLVDVLKVEVPVNLKYVEGTRAFARTKAYSKAEALDFFRRAAAVAKKPFIYLSAGVSNAEFTENLELAAEAGVAFCGVLCGRATWQDGIPVYAKQGVKALEDWLTGQGVKNIEAVNQRLAAAHPWSTYYDVGVGTPASR
ncbi:MAG: tagatose 1,6-diphosphate aldolase [Acidobacteria bacterium]|nr:tagatose 1,6-diphosphate aldolase [Acidobacteriota bacterium]